MSTDRLRQPPAERFAPPAQLFDLKQAAEELRREPTDAHQGHRQKTLYKRGDTTTALFVFEPGGSLPPHAAGGIVVIQAIEGRFLVSHGGRSFTLDPCQILTFAPDVPHDVRSPEGGVMLLTVSLNDA